MNTTTQVPGSKPTTNIQTGMQTGNTGQVVPQSQVQTGNGVMGATGPVPDQSGPLFSNVMQQLRAFVPKNVADDFETALAKATSKLKEAIGTSQEMRANNEMETKRVALKENEATIEESKKKLDEAEAKKKSGNIFDILSLVFQAIGAALAAALAAVAIATGAGAALGAILIATAVLAFVSLANSITAKANDGTGIAGSIAKATGGDDTAVMAAESAFAGALVVATLALLPVAIAKNPMATIEQMKESTANLLKGLTQIAQAVVATLDAGVQVGRAGLNVSATEDRTEATKLRAESTEMQAMMQQLDDIIDMALSLLMQINNNVNAILDKLGDLMKDTGDTLSNTRI